MSFPAHCKWVPCKWSQKNKGYSLAIVAFVEEAARAVAAMQSGTTPPTCPFLSLAYIQTLLQGCHSCTLMIPRQACMQSHAFSTTQHGPHFKACANSHSGF